MFRLILHFHELRVLVFDICICFLIFTVKTTFSQLSSTGCVLNLRNITYSKSSTCEEGTWGGFLSDPCCKGEFHEYLYGLAQRANQTGHIYLGPTEQRNCLITMKGSESDIMSCGIEKLTSGSKGCSDFSVQDATNRLGHELKSLKQNCGSLSLGGEWSSSCGSCVKSWEDMKGQKPYDFQR